MQTSERDTSEQGHFQHLPQQPRWTTLAWLSALVLGLHLMPLLDRWVSFSLASLMSDSHTAAWAPVKLNTSPSQAQSVQAVHRAHASPPRPVMVSSVRWIVAAAPEPAAPPKPKQHPKPAPQRAPADPVPQPDLPPSDPPHEAPAPQQQEILASEAAAVSPDASQTATQATPSQPPMADVLMPAGGAGDVAQKNANANAALDPHAQASTLPPPLTFDPSLLTQASVPDAVQLMYQVTGYSRGLKYHAQGRLQWLHERGQYELSLDVRIPLLGSRAQHSRGRIQPYGLEPERFADLSRSERAAHFDYESSRIRFSNNQPDAVLYPGAQDSLSMFMQMAAIFNAQPQAYTAGQMLAWQVATASKADLWRWQVGELEWLDLPAGKLQARRLVREPMQARDLQVELWLAPEFSYLPVQIYIVKENGDRLEQQLSERPLGPSRVRPD